MLVRVTTRFAIVAVGINTLLGLMIAASQAQVLAPVSDVKAIVFDETGAVIPDCEIAFNSDFERTVSHTGADGSVTVKLRDGRYTLRASKAGFAKADVPFFVPMPDPLRVYLKVDHTPTDGGLFEGVPTTASDLPNIMEQPELGPLPTGGGSMPLIRIVPSPVKNRSWQCLYLWKCSSHRE